MTRCYFLLVVAAYWYPYLCHHHGRCLACSRFHSLVPGYLYLGPELPVHLPHFMVAIYPSCFCPVRVIPTSLFLLETTSNLRPRPLVEFLPSSINHTVQYCPMIQFGRPSRCLPRAMLSVSFILFIGSVQTYLVPGTLRKGPTLLSCGFVHCTSTVTAAVTVR